MNRFVFKIGLKIICLVGLGCNHALADAGVASAHPMATAAGIEVLKQGGNAFDAAIAISATLAVVEPAGSGMGGGGFWLLYDADKEQSIMLDGREKAPLAATRDMYLDGDGEIIKGLSIDGPLAAAIPGQPAALAWLASHYGSMPLSMTLKPAIDAASNGFSVTEKYQRQVGWRLDAIKKSQDAADIFLDQGEIPDVGTKIIQSDLAEILWILGIQGHDGFYSGEVAEKLVQGVQQAGGIWTLEDLKNYEVAVRQPVHASYKGMKITSASLPSSGGLVLAEMFNILENYEVESLTETDFTHITVEAMRRAYRDRAEYMGDPDFVEVPVEQLSSKHYALGLSQSIRMDQATPSTDLAPTWEPVEQGEDTTHFSVIDEDGNRVAATLSINYSFGSGFIPPGTGVLLNDEMDDFSSKPGVPNVYGLVGAQANAIEPGKRMLSSMSPTFLEDQSRIAVIGTPGGSRIISMLMLGALEFFKGSDAQSIVNRPRFHHQYLPDAIQYEPDALSEDVINDLKHRGHQFKAIDWQWGNMHVVIQDKESGVLSAASDSRGEGDAIVIP